MVYQHRSVRENETEALRRDVRDLRRRLDEVAITSSTTVDADDIVRAVSANARNRKRMRKMDRTIERQAQQIDQLQLMVVQLIRKGGTLCQEQCCSSERQSQSSQ